MLRLRRRAIRSNILAPLVLASIANTLRNIYWFIGMMSQATSYHTGLHTSYIVFPHVKTINSIGQRFMFCLTQLILTYNYVSIRTQIKEHKIFT